MGKPSRKIRSPDQQAKSLARSIGVPAAQLDHGLAIQDVANRTEADQRHSLRSKETRTVRKLTRIDKLKAAGTISREEAQACEWYAEAHALGYETLGITADYERSGGGGDCVITHLAKYKAQQEARANYAFARSVLPAPALGLFERVVIGGEAIGGKGRAHELLRKRFRLTAAVLHERILHLLPIR